MYSIYLFILPCIMYMYSHIHVCSICIHVYAFDMGEGRDGEDDITNSIGYNEYICFCIYVCFFVCLHICIYIYIYIYIYE
jgi:hypothetical protein